MKRVTSVLIKRLPNADGLPEPRYQSAGAAGLDLIAATPAGETVVVASRARVAVPTGLVLELPDGFEAQVRPRSGLALNHGVTVLNSPGTIDADYRGEVIVILINLGTEPFLVQRGARIAQLVINRVERAELEFREQLNETARGPRGFGSTGGSIEGDE